ncbi:hypothetical protein K435DRAFT_772637 [Dendrothele bispora CBS 962.96]|uniref:Uncharacterized protein n=1 Tax=Dendrothele bispora (strain CBS 962.96) TaxID=1314807 RepID=A0A4S8MVH7_DENBC|nr:hypothetical protein K435DRAFT_772637 [Dendrothele bispora CBS 962.96]
MCLEVFAYPDESPSQSEIQPLSLKRTHQGNLDIVFSEAKLIQNAVSDKDNTRKLRFIASAYSSSPRVPKDLVVFDVNLHLDGTITWKSITQTSTGNESYNLQGTTCRRISEFDHTRARLALEDSGQIKLYDLLLAENDSSGIQQLGPDVAPGTMIGEWGEETDPGPVWDYVFDGFAGRLCLVHERWVVVGSFV